MATRRGRSTSVLVTFLALLAFSAAAFAHPMGNFSINHYAKIRVGQRSVEILYLVDMAETPTYQDMRQFGFAAQAGAPETLAYLDGQAAGLKQGVTLEIDGRAVALETLSREVVFADGAGGLPTMKLSFVYRAPFDGPAGTHKLSYADNNFPGRAGWKEVVAGSDGATLLDSTAPAVDRSNELSVYATDSLTSPPQQLSALLTFRTADPLPGNSNATTQALIAPASSVASPNPLAEHAPAHNRAAAAEKPIAPAKPPALAPSAAASSPPPGRTSDQIANVPAAASRPAAPARNTPRSSFTELISTQRKLGFWFLLTAAAIAMWLGALHALEPGHGKTVVAAYLVGSRGTAGHAVLLGLVVTAAHTAGVYALGGVTLYASRYFVPDQLYPWLGVISGLSVAAVAAFTLLRHLTGVSGEHSHAPGARHSHWFSSLFKQSPPQQSAEQTSAPAGARDADSRPPSLRELCVLGISGGIVPCPAALVVLLSAFSLHRIGLGLFLITAFSVGLAGVLVLVGLTMVYAKRLVSPRVRSRRSPLRHIPLFSSALMAFLGIGIAVSAFSSAPVGKAFLSGDKLVPFVMVTLLGLFLGMRHSTDPDHVVAVSTIVSRQRSIRSSATIGLLWGLGHTLTIFLVGSAIIIFGVVIPPRLGLSMELGVALMLVLLGVLNLTGILQSITQRWTPASTPAAWKETGDTGRERANDDGRDSARVGIATAFSRTASKLGLYQTLRPLVVGLVHGLAGSAAVALLVLSTIKNPFWSTVYLLVFGFGTMLGMMIMTAAISAPLVLAGRRFSAINRHLTAVSGFASVAFGLFLVYHIGFVDGLFTAHVRWIPQ